MKVSKTKSRLLSRARHGIVALILMALGSSATGQKEDPYPARVVTRYALTSGPGYSSHDPASWQLFGSNDDGQNWAVLDSRTGQVFEQRNLRKAFFITNQIPYNVYRLEIDSTPGISLAANYLLDQSVQLAEWELIGPFTGMVNESDVRTVVTSSRPHPVTGPAENVFDDDLTTLWIDYGLRQSGKSWVQCKYAWRSETMVTNLYQLRVLDRLDSGRRLLYAKGPEILTNLASGKTHARTLTGYALTSANDEPDRDPRDWRLLGSADGGRSWATLDQRRNEVFSTRLRRRVFGLTNAATFPLYRLQIDAPRPTNGLVQLAEIEPLTTTSPDDDQYSLAVSAQRENPPLETADMAFDGESKTKWLAFSSDDRNQPLWIQWQYLPREAGLPVINLHRLERFLDQEAASLSARGGGTKNSARTVVGYALTSANDFPGRDPRDWRLLGSNDGGKTWQTLDQRRNETFPSRFARRVFSLTNQIAYAAYRLQVDSVAAPGFVNSVQLAELEPLYATPESPGTNVSLRVSSHGYYARNLETVDKLFDGNSLTKWLDNSAGDTNHASWVQWEYSIGEAQPVVNLDLRHVLQPWSPPTLKLDLEGVCVYQDPTRLGIVDGRGFQILEVGADASRASPGRRVRLTGTLIFGADTLRLEKADVAVLGTAPSLTNLFAAGAFTASQPFALGTVEGTVTSMLHEKYYTTLRLVVADGIGVTARVMNLDNHRIPDYTQCRLSLRGLAASVLAESGRRVAGTLWISGDDGISMIRSTENEPAPVKAPPEFDPQTTITNISRVKELLQSQRPGTFRVNLRGVITYIDLDLGDFYLQQGQDGVLVFDQLGAGLCPLTGQEGSYVEFQGIVQDGGLYPTAFVHVLGGGLLPEPRHHSWDYLMTGNDDGQWVRVEGLVSAVEDHRLTLVVTGGQLIVWINQLDKEAREHLLGSRVRIDGVCASVVNSRNQRLGVRLLVPSGENIEFVAAAPDDPFTLPTVAIRQVMQSDGTNGATLPQLVKTAGVVTHHEPRLLFIQDGTDGLRVYLREVQPVTVGDRVEVVGLAEPDGFSPKLVQALVRKTGWTNLPPASPIHLSDVGSGTDQTAGDATRGRIDAILLGEGFNDQLATLELRGVDDGRVFSAFLSATTNGRPDLPVGGELRLTGVFKAKTETAPDMGEVVTAFEMYLNSPADIQILKRPSWWTAKHTWWSLGGAAGGLLLALAWGLLLRRQVREQTRELSVEIGERKSAEKALREQEEFIHNVIDTDPSMIFVKDREGRYTLVNRARAEFGGQSVGDIVGKLERDLNPHAEQVAAFQKDDREVMDTRREKFVSEEKFTSRQGRTVWLQTVKRPLIGRDGTARHVLGVSMDITERKLAADRIREQALLLDLAPDAIFVLGLDHRIQYWNKESGNLYGYPAGEAVGRLYEEVFDPVSRAHFEAAEKAVLDKGEWSGEFNWRSRPGREMVISGRWTLLRDEEGKPRSVLIINTDVTEKKRLEAELLRAQRMEGIGTLAAGMAHDLNNILAPIVMSAGSLRWELAPEMREMAISRIEMSVKRGAGIIQQVLTFARGVCGQRSPIAPTELLEEVLGLVSQTFPKDITITVESEPGTRALLGDRTQMQQVLLNLAINSRDAMLKGGTLRMRAGNATDADVPAGRSPSTAPGSLVLLRVEDTGCGIPAANLERIFDPFFTTKELGRGTGLGLATVLGIVKSHQGFVAVESVPNQGTVFKVFLPATSEPVVKHVTPDIPAAAAGGGERVLVVDDEVNIAAIAQITLEQSGYKVSVANNGGEALRSFGDGGPPIDLVLTDIMMPHMDGLALIKALRRMNPELKIIAASGLGKDLGGGFQMAELNALGVSKFLNKPYTGSELLATVAQVLRQPSPTIPAA